MPRKTMIPILVDKQDKLCTITYAHPVKDWGKVIAYEIWKGKVCMCSTCDMKCPVSHNVTHTTTHYGNQIIASILTKED